MIGVVLSYPIERSWDEQRYRHPPLLVTAPHSKITQLGDVRRSPARNNAV